MLFRIPGDIAANVCVPLPKGVPDKVNVAGLLPGVASPSSTAFPNSPALRITIRTSTFAAYPTSSPGSQPDPPAPRLPCSGHSNTMLPDTSSVPSISRTRPRRHTSFRFSTADGHTRASTKQSPSEPVNGNARPLPRSKRWPSVRGFQSASAEATSTTHPGTRCGFWRNQLRDAHDTRGERDQPTPGASDARRIPSDVPARSLNNRMRARLLEG